MKSVLNYLAKNWLTTLIGAVQTASAVIEIKQNPKLLADSTTITKLTAGLTLIAARDPGAASAGNTESPASGTGLPAQLAGSK